jgi:hypothetical protein
MNYQNNLWTELCFNTMNWLIEFQISIVWKCKPLVLFIKWTYLLKNCGVAYFDKEVKLYGWEKYIRNMKIYIPSFIITWWCSIYIFICIFFWYKEGIAKSLSAYLSICETYNFFSSCESKHRMENEVDHMFASNKIGSHIVLLENKLLSKLQFVDNNTN